MNCKNVCDLPASRDITDNDGILITQNGAAKRMTMPLFRKYVGYATGADVLGVPVPTSADAGCVPVVKPDGTGYQLVDGAIALYTHTKTGTVHKFAGTGTNGRVKLTANVAMGDTVQLNGKTVPAYVGTEIFADALAGEALSGRWLSFVWDGAQVNFKGGGGLSATKLALADAVPADVRRGKTFYAGGRGRQVGTAEYPQYLGVVSATTGANAVLADYTLTPGVWRIVAAAWRDNREYGYIAVQVGGTEHGGIEPTYGHGRVLDVTLNLTENTGCRVLTRSDYVVGGCWAIVRQP